MSAPDITIEPSPTTGTNDLAERRVGQYVAAFPDLDKEAIEAGFRLASVCAAQSAALLRLFGQLSVDLTLPRHSVLRFLYLAEPERRTQNDIKNDLGVTSPSMTFLIDGLEASELVVRSRNPTDRREIFVELTTAGRELAAKFVPEMPGYFSEMFSDLSESEKRTLNRLLKKLNQKATAVYQG